MPPHTTHKKDIVTPHSICCDLFIDQLALFLKVSPLSCEVVSHSSEMVVWVLQVHITPLHVVGETVNDGSQEGRQVG